ncbi:TetR/AcrR family transcriptional regulator [Pararoseomonas indoligenes]|uniref:TetR/AcrR family transcriptional regulator n=1 Tax=Roseomonas indoligenes TaxID=2820811 RepID=A0A940N1A0_9PROT|nr:TetR/AcrR family transcriptional regulator [Pararoseomonas indoligenes]MBP0494880.1 TetR/AcrR family transcriptional regulator [Pararoseomonas indoligenes]
MPAPSSTPDLAAPSADPPRRGPGRPRAFDMDVALDKALLVFRERGYNATSVSDLAEAMGLATGSLYKAFTDKRGVFLAAFAHYERRRRAELQGLMDPEPTGFGKLRALLHSYAELSHDREGQRGCLVTGTANELATLDPEMAAQVRATVARTEAAIRDLLRLGQVDGTLSAALDIDAAARLLLSVLQGFRVVGKLGRARDEMVAAADQALRLLA